MCQSASKLCPLIYNPKKLLSQYFAQRVPTERQQPMAGVCAVTFRPGGFSGSFEGRTILPAGAGVMFMLHYERFGKEDGQEGWRIPVQAFHATVQSSGSVEYSGAGRRLHMDLARRPRAGSKGRTIDLERNPALLETALRLDRACQRSVQANRRLSAALQLPRVLLGFPAERLPAFRDTPFLRNLAARHLRVPYKQLGANGSLLLERLLLDVWQGAIIQPDNPRNRTGTALIDARLCPGETQFLRVYEDYGEMLGAPASNPAREVKLEEFTNPAGDVLGEVGLGDRPDFNQPVDHGMVIEMMQRMRQRLGELSGRFSPEDLLDAITTADEPLVAWSVELPRLRARLAAWAAQACADEDLKIAVRNRSEPLWVRHACQVQVLWRDAVSDLISDPQPAPVPQRQIAHLAESELPIAV